MKRILVAAVLTLTATAAFADPIAERQQIMKGVGAATKAGAALAKGEMPFDEAKAREVLQTYVDAAARMPGLFPDDSKEGGDTTAAPKIWEDMAGFKAEFAKFGEDAEKGLASLDQASFAATFGTVTQHCKTCHESYRVKKN